MTAESVSIALSGVAILVSVWAARKAYRAAKRQNDIQERLLTLESARERDRVAETRQAKLRAAILNDGRDYLLTIRNQGAVQAGGIDILVDGKKPQDHDRVLANPEEAVSALGPDAEVSFPLVVTMGSPTMYHVALSWDDDTGQRGRWESQLNI